MIKKFLILLIVLFVLIIPVNAIINVTPSNIGTTFIYWEWNVTEPLTNISIDGINTCFINPNTSSFSLTGLNPNEIHTIVVTTRNDIGINITSTLQSSSNIILDYLASYIIFIVAIVIILIGIFVDFVGFIGSIIALSQLVIYANQGNFILGVLWFIVCIAGILTCKTVGLLNDS